MIAYILIFLGFILCSALFIEYAHFFAGVAAFLVLIQKPSASFQKAITPFLSWFIIVGLFFGSLPNLVVFFPSLSSTPLNYEGDIFYFLVIFSVAFSISCLKKSEWKEILDSKQDPLLSRQKTIIWFLIGAFLAGFLLRLYGLELSPPTYDEQYHLVAAKQIFSGELHWTEVYKRSLYFVTLPVAASFHFFGEASLFTARFPIVLLNMLAIIPLFFLAKRIHVLVGYVAVILFVLSPWIIGISRIVREYAVFPFLFFLLALFLVFFLEEIHKRFQDLAQKKRVFSDALSTIIFATGVFVFFLPLWFMFFFDIHSTFRVAVSLYTTFFILFAVSVYRIFPRLRIVFAFVIGLLCCVFLFLSFRESAVGLLPDFDPYWLSLFFGFDSSPHQWFYQLGPVLPLFFFLSAILFFWRSKNTTLAFVGISFLIVLYAYSFHIGVSHRPRYIFHVEFWYLILFASGCVFFWRSLTYQKSPIFQISLFVLLVFSLVNPLIIIRSLNLDIVASHNVPATDEHHYFYSGALDYIQNHADPEKDVLVSTIFHRTAYFFANMDFQKKYGYSYRNPDRLDRLKDIIKNHEQGFIVLDAIRNGELKEGLPRHDFDLGGVLVRMVFDDGNFQVYKWGL